MSAHEWKDPDPLPPDDPPRTPLTRPLVAAAVILVGLGFLTVFTGIATAAVRADASPTAVPAPAGLLAAVGGAMIVLGLAGIASGIGLLARRLWARALALVMSGLGVMAGTAGLVGAVLQPDASRGSQAASWAGPLALIAVSGFVAWAIVQTVRRERATVE